MFYNSKYAKQNVEYDIISNEIVINTYYFQIKTYLRRTEKYTIERIKSCLCINADVPVLKKLLKEDKIKFVNDNWIDFYKAKNRHSELVRDLNCLDSKEIAYTSDISIESLKEIIQKYLYNEVINKENPLLISVYNGYNNSAMDIIRIE